MPDSRSNAWDVSSCWWHRIAAVVLALAVSVPAPVAAQEADNQIVDQIVAVVGDDIVLKSDVDQLVSRMVQQRRTNYTDDMWMQALDQLIDQKILAEEARRDTTITVSDGQLENQLSRRIDQLKQQAGGEDALEEAYGKSVLELKESFKEDFRDQILAQQLRQRRMQKIEITPSEVKRWFERIPRDSLPRLPKTVRLAHVVRYPKASESAKKQAKQRITSIRDSILNHGASFEAMARAYSDDSGSASSGGRLTGVALDDLVPEYHIVRVNSRDGGTVDLNHILIRVDGSADGGTQAIEYLEAVRDTLTTYEEVPFELMAKRHSEEEESANNGGRVTDPRSGSRDLVLQALGPSWRRTIRSLEVGEISEPTEVQLLNGERAYHIVKLQKRTPAHRVNLEQDYERIRQYALQDKRQREMNDWLTGLREEIYVDVRISKDDLTAMR